VTAAFYPPLPALRNTPLFGRLAGFDHLSSWQKHHVHECEYRALVE